MYIYMKYVYSNYVSRTRAGGIRADAALPPTRGARGGALGHPGLHAPDRAGLRPPLARHPPHLHLLHHLCKVSES